VVLVAASARSGTTLLGSLLDLHPEVTFAGELNRRRAWGRSSAVCGCGRPFTECPCWAPVLGRPAFPDEPAAGDRWATIVEVDQLEARSRRPVALVRALVGRPAPEQRRYVAYLDQLCRDLAAQRGARVVVDTSKLNLVELLLMRSSSGLDCRVVHLHRDPRGVVFSRLSGARDRRSSGWDRHAKAVQLGWPLVLADALRWDRSNLLLRLLRRRLEPVTVLSYDRLVAESEPTVRALVAELGLDPDPLSEAWIAPDLVELPDNHSMSGNRVRRRRGATPVVADLRWRDGLSPAMAAVVQALTAPVRRMLGGRSHPRPAG